MGHRGLLAGGPRSVLAPARANPGELGVAPDRISGALQLCLNPVQMTDQDGEARTAESRKADFVARH